CAITMGGIPYCSGNPERGQLGSATGGVLDTAANAAPGLWAHVTTGERHGCGVPRANQTLAPPMNGRAWCWGANDNGQLGTGDFVDRLAPVLVARPALGVNLDSTSVVAGGSHTCALENTALADRDAYCWGSNGFGQLGKDSLGGRDSL